MLLMARFKYSNDCKEKVRRRQELEILLLIECLKAVPWFLEQP